MEILHRGSYLLRNCRPVGFSRGEKPGFAAGRDDEGRDGCEVLNGIDAARMRIGIGPDGTVRSVEPEEGGGPADGGSREGPGAGSRGACQREFDLEGGFLSPAWIDLHTHIYFGATDLSVRPSGAGPETGVLLPVDAGSAGADSFGGFWEYVAAGTNFPVRAFLNLSPIGLVASNRISELGDPALVDPEAAAQTAAGNRSLIRGIKLRASGRIVGQRGEELVRAGLRAAERAGLPLVVHVGAPPLCILELLRDYLRPGDLLTHCFTGKKGASLAGSPELLEAYHRARERGIIFDLGHGAASFSLNAARRAMEGGFPPCTISTDLHVGNIRGPVWDLPTTMSKMLYLGLDLEGVVEAVTANPARFLGLKEWDVLGIGSRARFTAFELLRGEFEVEDAASAGERTVSARRERTGFTLNRFISPRLVFQGPVVYASRSRHPAVAGGGS